MKLASLHLRIIALNTVAGGNPNDDRHSITFDCPRCGPPFVVSILCRLNGPPDERTSTWEWRVTGNGDGEITVSPSINNRDHGHRKACGWHGSIVNGSIEP